MVRLSERKLKNVKLIYDNPQLTGNQLYEKAKKQGFGIKKQEFYKTLRIIRKLPEPTIEKKLKAVPIRYRKPIVKIEDLPIPEKEGSYGIIEIQTKDDEGNEKEFYVKYYNTDTLKDQLNKIKRKYKTKIKKITFKGFFGYHEYIDKEFKQLLESVGIDL